MSRTQNAPSAQRQPTAAPVQKEIDPNAALLDDIMERTVARLDKWAEKFGSQLNDPNVVGMRRAFITGLGIQRLRDMMDEATMKLLRSLMNTVLGFMTDRGPGKKEESYPENVVRDCAIEATLKGVLWIDNHFNIIAGRCYITQEGYAYKLNQIDGLEWRPIPGVPKSVNGGATVRYGVRWKYKGVTGELVDADGKPGVEFPIKTDSHSGVDAILGKAKRKALKLAFDTILGIKGHDRDDDEPDAELISVANEADRITDAQVADLNAEIAEHAGSAQLIREHYGLAAGQRLLSAEFTGCMSSVAAGKFSAPKTAAAPTQEFADGEIPNEETQSDMVEHSAEEVERAIINAGSIPAAVFKRYGVKRAADLSQEQRREIVEECMQTVPH